jgi:hypothetical protein
MMVRALDDGEGVYLYVPQVLDDAACALLALRRTPRPVQQLRPERETPGARER